MSLEVMLLIAVFRLIWLFFVFPALTFFFIALSLLARSKGEQGYFRHWLLFAFLPSVVIYLIAYL